MGQPRAWVPPQIRASLHPQSIPLPPAPPPPVPAAPRLRYHRCGQERTHLGCPRCRQPPSLAGSPLIPKMRLFPPTFIPPPTPPPRSRLPPASPRLLHLSLSELRGSSPEQEKRGVWGAAFIFPFYSPLPAPAPSVWKRGCKLEKGCTTSREVLFQDKKDEREVLGTNSHVSPHVTYKNCPFFPFLGSRGGG